MPTLLEARCYLTRENPEVVIHFYETRAANNHLMLMDKTLCAIHIHIGTRLDMRGYPIPFREFGLHAQNRTRLEATKRNDYTAALRCEVQQVLVYAMMHRIPLWLFEGEQTLELFGG